MTVSPFWKYVYDTLRWGLIDKPGVLQAIVKGIALGFDSIRGDAVFMRGQWFTQLCEPEIVPDHGYSRGIVRHHTEIPEQFRQRVIHAYAWHMKGGKWQGLPEILKFYGFNLGRLEGITHYQPSRWAEFQVKLAALDDTPSNARLLESMETLVWLVNEYKPARSKLARLYNDAHNLTPLIFSEGKYGYHFYTHFSGVPSTYLGEGWKDKELLISFGHKFGVTVLANKKTGTPCTAGRIARSVCITKCTSLVYGFFKYSDTVPDYRIASSFITSHGTDWIEKIEYPLSWAATPPKTWLAVWSDSWEAAAAHFVCATWSDAPWTRFHSYDRHDRVFPKLQISFRQTACSQLVYSSGHSVYSGFNANYGAPVFTVVRTPPVFGYYVYSNDVQRELTSVPIQTRTCTGIHIPSREHGKVPEIQHCLTMGAAPNPVNIRGWRKCWVEQKWLDDHIFTPLIFQEEA